MRTHAAQARGRPGLSREAVVARALEIGTAEGLEAVSLRRLAQELGVTPMALYRHVRDKQDLDQRHDGGRHSKGSTPPSGSDRGCLGPNGCAWGSTPTRSSSTRVRLPFPSASPTAAKGTPAILEGARGLPGHLARRRVWATRGDRPDPHAFRTSSRGTCCSSSRARRSEPAARCPRARPAATSDSRSPR